MKRLLATLTSYLFLTTLFAQDIGSSPWHIPAQDIDPSNYYGVTVANGMVGLVSSPEPFKVKDVVLNGVYDHYKRGRVSNFLKGFNHVNMNLDINGRRQGPQTIEGYEQVLDMKKAKLTTTFFSTRASASPLRFIQLETAPIYLFASGND